jgi:hypothetical protein
VRGRLAAGMRRVFAGWGRRLGVWRIAQDDSAEETGAMFGLSESHIG